MYLGHNGTCGFCGNAVRQGYNVCGSCNAEWTNGTSHISQGQWSGGAWARAVRTICLLIATASLCGYFFLSCIASAKVSTPVEQADLQSQLPTWGHVCIIAFIIYIPIAVITKKLFFVKNREEKFTSGHWHRRTYQKRPY